MRRSRQVTLMAMVCLLALCGTALAQWTTDTTLAKETSNNTSAARTFAGMYSKIPGHDRETVNEPAGNTSKVDIHKLLYPGSTTTVYAHYMPWFGNPYSNHLRGVIGYDESEMATVRGQRDDAKSRGIAGFIVDWYGNNDSQSHTWMNRVTANVKRAAEEDATFTFAVMEDINAYTQVDGRRIANQTEKMEDDIAFANSNYFGSSHYIRDEGRPVLFFFNSGADKVDWDDVKAFASTHGNPKFVFYTPHKIHEGFAHAASDGAYAWLSTDDPDFERDYLRDYYHDAATHKNLYSMGSMMKGFNSSAAGWGRNRYIGQQCGETWVNSGRTAANNYSPEHPLARIQVVTWNDYEEGTEIESGIGNCTTYVDVALAGSILTITIPAAANRDAIDHFKIYASRDGVNLKSLGTIANNATSVDLASYRAELPPGHAYKIYVKMVGVNSVANKMSRNYATYTPVARQRR